MRPVCIALCFVSLGASVAVAQPAQPAPAPPPPLWSGKAELSAGVAARLPAIIDHPPPAGRIEQGMDLKSALDAVQSRLAR